MNKNLLSVFISLVLFMFLTACGPSRIPSFGGQVKVKSAEEAHTVKKSAQALDFQITEFQWESIPEIAIVVLSGTAVNESAEAHQAVRATIMVYDDKGRLVGNGSPYLRPSYLAPGAKGNFEFKFMFKGRVPESLRLEAAFFVAN